MRYKFRAWNKEKKEWVMPEFGGEICVGGDFVIVVNYKPKNGGYVLKSATLLTWEEIEKLEISQFTGVHDKNGKEIYEGDVINHPYAEISQSRVEFHSGAFRTHYGRYLSNFTCIDGKCEDIEIIGNIYENPELLEAGSRKAAA